MDCLREQRAQACRWRGLRRDPIQSGDGRERDRRDCRRGADDGLELGEQDEARRLRALVQRTRDRAVFVIAAGVAFDTDQVILLAGVELLDERCRFELLAVLAARDVTRGGFVREARELANDEQHDRNRGNVGSRSTHTTTLPQMRLNCS